MGKIKNTSDKNKINIHKSKAEPICNQRKEDVLFEFGHITDKKGYSYNALLEKCANDKNALKEYFHLINVISSSTWEKLATRNKNTIGGFETMCLSNLCCNINDKYNKEMTKDTKLLVFRFGSGDAYRMVGYKSHNCSRVIHILGFDLDHKLYDHGK